LDRRRVPQYFDGFSDKDSSSRQGLDSLFLNFRLEGRLPSLRGDRSPQDLLRLSDADIDALAPAELKKLVARLCRYAFVRAICQRVAAADKKLLSPARAWRPAPRRPPPPG